MMDVSLSFTSIAALFVAMLIGASMPTVSSLAVLARSATSGFSHGALTALGIVAGDITFILIAIYGLSFLADTLGDLFVIVKYLGGAYLIWLGSTLWMSKSDSTEVEAVIESSMLASFLTGLFITLIDLKAILFYLGFLPAFIDMFTISFIDTGIILIVTMIAVGTPKLAYALMADRARLFSKNARAKKVINIVAGSVMIAVGVFLIVQA